MNDEACNAIQAALDRLDWAILFLDALQSEGEPPWPDAGEWLVYAKPQVVAAKAAVTWTRDQLKNDLARVTKERDEANAQNRHHLDELQTRLQQSREDFDECKHDNIELAKELIEVEEARDQLRADFALIEKQLVEYREQVRYCHECYRGVEAERDQLKARLQQIRERIEVDGGDTDFAREIQKLCEP